EALAPGVDAEGASRLEMIRRTSAELVQVFRDDILPAIDRQQWDEVRRSHDRANALVDAMTEQADELTEYFGRGASAAEERAKDVQRVVLTITIMLAVAAALLALVAGTSLWRAFSGPLGDLERVALAVEQGERRARVGRLAAAELAVVAESFNRMLD